MLDYLSLRMALSEQQEIFTGPLFQIGVFRGFHFASKFLSREKGCGRGMPRNLVAAQATFLEGMRKDHYEKWDPRTKGKHLFDPIKHSYNTQTFIA
jgi:hypothetical protein